MNKFFWGVLLFLVIISCSKKQGKVANMHIRVHFNKLHIMYGNQDLLNGGLPLFQNQEIKVHEVVTKHADNETVFEFIHDMKDHIEVKAKINKAKKVICFSVSPNGNHSKIRSDFIGLFFDSIPSYDVGNAFFKYAPVKAWTYPKQIQHLDSLADKDNQFFIWRYKNGTYGAAMPLAGKGYVSSIGSYNGAFGNKAYSYVDGLDSSFVPMLAVAFGTDPYKMIDDLYEEGFETMGITNHLRKNKKFPPILENIGWCTWNAFQHNISEAKLLEGVKVYKDNGFPLPFLLIDDGWLTITEPNGKLKSFEADRNKFPNGLKNFVQKAKDVYGIKHVGVWHAFNGYWSGIDLQSELGKDFKHVLTPYVDKVTWTDNEPSVFYAPTPRSSKGMLFYDKWYSYLSSQGISFVKVDNQLIMDRICKNNYPFWDAAKQGQANFQDAVIKHFDGNSINCMNMTVDALYNYKTSVARAVEDYFPDNNSYQMHAGNEAVHVLSAVNNSIWCTPIVWPDFDMFQTHKPNAVYHAIARAISAGPIYLTDIPGKQNFDIIRALTFKNGKIIRSDVPARPTEDCLFQVQEPKPFKAFSFSGTTGLIGVWNAADADQVNGILRPRDAHGITGQKFFIYEYFSKKGLIGDSSMEVKLSLSRLACQLYFVVPCSDFAAVGLVNKYNAPKTIVRQKIDKSYVEIELAEQGEFVAYSERTPVSVTCNGINILNKISYKNNILRVELLQEHPILNISF